MDFRNSVRLAIRKIMYAPAKQGEQPSIEVSKEFMMSPNKLHLEASLDKELYHHGESIAVNVHIANNSNRTVKRVKVSVRQFADICLFSTAQYKCTVAEVEAEYVLNYISLPSMNSKVCRHTVDPMISLLASWFVKTVMISFLCLQGGLSCWPWLYFIQSVLANSAATL